MDIDISVTACLQFVFCQEKLLIKLFVELVENKTSLGGYQSRIGVGIFLVSDIHNCLALLVYFVKHMYEILLVVAIVLIAFCDGGVERFKRILNDVVHFAYGNKIFVHRCDLFVYEVAYKLNVLIAELHEGSVS